MKFDEFKKQIKTVKFDLDHETESVLMAAVKEDGNSETVEVNIAGTPWQLAQIVHSIFEEQPKVMDALKAVMLEKAMGKVKDEFNSLEVGPEMKSRFQEKMEQMREEAKASN